MLKEYLRRTGIVVFGQLLSGIGVTMLVQANVGIDPWNALHQGISLVTGIAFGRVTILTGAGVIALALLMGERIGIGTIIGITVPGFLIDYILDKNLIPQQTAFGPGLLMLIAGLEILTLGTWIYMSQCLGTGPRDALMVAVARRTPFSTGICRAVIELLVTLTGWLLGAKVGIGTVISAFGIGILFQLNFRLLRFDPKAPAQEDLSRTYKLIKAGGKTEKQAQEEGNESADGTRK